MTFPSGAVWIFKGCACSTSLRHQISSASCGLQASEHRATTLNEADQNRNHSQDEQNVDESTQGVRADHAQQPQDQQQDRYSPEHWLSFLESIYQLTGEV